MSEKNSGVILLGIIAFASLGLSGFMFLKNEIIFPSNNPTYTCDTVIRNVWYVEKFDSQYNLDTTYQDIPFMNISVTVNTGESIYLLFNADAAIFGVNITSSITINVKINGTRLDHPFVMLGSSTFIISTYSSISLQYSNRTMPVGDYNIAICANSTSTSNWIKDRSLYVYTYV